MLFNSVPNSRFVFISSNATPWGGSEELWSATAVALAEAGHFVSVLKPNIPADQLNIRRLRELSCTMRDLSKTRIVGTRIARAASPLLRRLLRFEVRRAITRMQPDLVVISQGMNFDGVLYAEVCRRIRQRYVLIAQKADDAHWPHDGQRGRMRAAYTEARACWFVAEHNRRLTEEQIGRELVSASVVRNPFLVPWEKRDDWPSEERGLRLACIGRLYPPEKGQDLLIRVLARPKWRERALSVTVFGDGHYRLGLEEMAQHYGLTSIAFAGFIDDAASVWNDHHGLLLPSRAEGLPLVVVEAMLSGRVPIVSDVAGNAEVVRAGVTGFVAAAPTVDAIDEALDRAWQRRAEWRAIGAAAAEEIRTLVPPDPARTLAAKLLALLPQTAPESAAVLA